MVTQIDGQDSPLAHFPSELHARLSDSAWATPRNYRNGTSIRFTGPFRTKNAPVVKNVCEIAVRRCFHPHRPNSPLFFPAMMPLTTSRPQQKGARDERNKPESAISRTFLTTPMHFFALGATGGRKRRENSGAPAAKQVPLFSAPVTAAAPARHRPQARQGRWHRPPDRRNRCRGPSPPCHRMPSRCQSPS